MEDLRTLIDALGLWSGRLMPDPERARQVQDSLRELTQSEDLKVSMPLSGPLLTKVEETCHRTARHLTLELHDSPSPPDQHAPGWPPVPAEEVAQRAGFIRSVSRLGRSGELRLDGFDEVEHAAPYLQAAFTLLRECDALILDLRSNGGGALSSLALVAGFLLGPKPAHLETVHRRGQPAKEWWTPGGESASTLPPHVPVAVLIGPGTYSSGEALAYHLRNRGRVRTFGARTPGAADHVTPVRVTPSVTALIPEGTPVDPITGANWERHGVQPDVECDPSTAVALARDWLCS